VRESRFSAVSKKPVPNSFAPSLMLVDPRRSAAAMKIEPEENLFRKPECGPPTGYCFAGIPLSIG
jgi:hypothetical protein